MRDRSIGAGEARRLCGESWWFLCLESPLGSAAGRIAAFTSGIARLPQTLRGRLGKLARAAAFLLAILWAGVFASCGYDEANVPKGWKVKSQRVSVATPDGEVEKDIAYFTNTVGMKLVKIPAGEFMMGSPDTEAGRYADEGPRRQVRISEPFYMGAHEVSQAQWEAVMGRNTNPSHFKRSGENAPVDSVSWSDCQEFVRKLSAAEGIRYRLPTEAEWEYACRAGTATRFYNGDSASGLNAIAWHLSNSERKTHPAGGKAPNAFGLYDMTGNVWEWCNDWYDSDTYAESPSVDPKGPLFGSLRVLRGGGWASIPKLCRSANRLRSSRTRPHSFNVGFRVVAVWSPEGK